MSAVMLTYQVIGKLSPKKPLFTGVSVFFIVHYSDTTIMYYFLEIFDDFSNFLRTFAVPKNSTPEKDEFDPILLLISLCGEQDRVFSWYMKSPYRRAEELSPLLAEFVKGWRHCVSCSWVAIRGFTQVSPYNPDLVRRGRRCFS